MNPTVSCHSFGPWTGAWLKRDGQARLPPLIADGQLAPLITCAERLAVAEALRLPAAPSARQVEILPAWAHLYPETLQRTLGELARVTDDAERIAGAVLGKDFPHPSDLQRETAAVAKLLAEAPDRRRRRRLDTLRERLRSPRPVSSVRVERLRSRLEARTRRCLLDDWGRRLDAELTAPFSRLLQTDDVPAWMFEPRQLRTLGPMMSLPAAFRSLGWRLLRARATSGPWNLVEDPANREYLTRLRRLGVNVEPWLRPRSRSCVGKNGRKVDVSFERDPLELFQMGSHFRTCLSPGGINYFSVFSVAADINKHVVYARDSRRVVVGRCLLALDDKGRLLTFYPYCHDEKLEFDRMIGELAQELAREMRTHVVGRGAVRCLVGPRWYDDGPVEVRFPFLAEGSEFRKSLPELADRDELVAHLPETIRPHAVERICAVRGAQVARVR